MDRLFIFIIWKSCFHYNSSQQTSQWQCELIINNKGIDRKLFIAHCTHDTHTDCFCIQIVLSHIDLMTTPTPCLIKYPTKNCSVRCSTISGAWCETDCYWQDDSPILSFEFIGFIGVDIESCRSLKHSYLSFITSSLFLSQTKKVTSQDRKYKVLNELTWQFHIFRSISIHFFSLAKTLRLVSPSFGNLGNTK